MDNADQKKTENCVLGVAPVNAGDALRLAVLPGVYEHYKGNRYVVIGVARDHESRREVVVYHPLVPHVDEHGNAHPIGLNTRPLYPAHAGEDAWLEPVETSAPGGIKQRFRFLYPIWWVAP